MVITHTQEFIYSNNSYQICLLHVPVMHFHLNFIVTQRYAKYEIFIYEAITYNVKSDTSLRLLILFHLQCKEWGFLLRELFGANLGTGDYGHLTIDHAPMLMRRFLSMRDYSQQGFEASHKDQRQLWLKASSHDCKGEATSSK